MLLLCGVAAAHAQPTRADAVDRHRTALQSRIEALRSTIRDTLRIRAPELLLKLDPAPPPVRQGYGLLPRIVPDAPQSRDSGRIVSVYSWPWTDSLIDHGLRRADTLDIALGQARQRADYDRVVAAFNALVAHRRLIDSHVEHNRQWQQAIVSDPARFASATTTIERILAGTETAPLSPPAIPRVEVALDESAKDTTTFRVPLVTDVVDSAFLRAFQAAVQSEWRRNVGPREYRIELLIRRVAPAALYCRETTRDCAPPVGAAIDVAEHVARFPAGVAILTTGATQTQVLGGRALVLGPRDIAPRTIAHEFGHLLGFDDAYLRGRRDLGADGFAVVELIPNRRDVMASPGFGSVEPRHFEQLEANLRADGAMRAGLAAMYDRRDAREAALRFREVLTFRPDHYGGTFQLAKALDATGDSTSATVVWRRMLEMATALNDAPTVRTIRSRLGLP